MQLQNLALLWMMISGNTLSVKVLLTEFKFIAITETPARGKPYLKWIGAVTGLKENAPSTAVRRISSLETQIFSSANLNHDFVTGYWNKYKGLPFIISASRQIQLVRVAGS